MKNVMQPSAKSLLIALGLTIVASTKDATFQKKIFGSGMTAFIISNQEMNDIMKIVKSLEDAVLL